MIVTYPANIEETKTIKSILLLLRIRFEEKNTISSHKKSVIKNVKEGFRELKLIEAGKLKTTSAKKFLDEL